jgi:hypothetical protein
VDRVALRRAFFRPFGRRRPEKRHSAQSALCALTAGHCSVLRGLAWYAGLTGPGCYVSGLFYKTWHTQCAMYAVTIENPAGFASHRHSCSGSRRSSVAHSHTCVGRGRVATLIFWNYQPCLAAKITGKYRAFYKITRQITALKKKKKKS